MSEKIVIEISDAHAGDVWIAGGIQSIISALEAVPDACKGMPGYQLALAIVQRESADARARVSQRSLRAVAKAGHNVSTTNVYTSLNSSGRPVVSIEDQIDLDLAP